MARHYTKVSDALEGIIALRKEGATHKEIADRYGLSPGTVCKVLHSYGLFGTTEHGRENSSMKGREAMRQALRLTPDEINARVIQYGFNWEYVSGYTGCDCMVTIRCKVCGCKVQKSFTSIRQKHSRPCENCARIEAEAKRARAEEEKKKRKAIAELERRKAITHVCKECGKTFIDKLRSAYCSPECAKRHENRIYSRRKDKRFLKSRKSLLRWQDIYQRTGDLHCVACGIECDVNDYIVTENGIKICGGRYPSIDHIIPVSKGGKDEWGNVQLMCRACNSQKSDRLEALEGWG